VYTSDTTVGSARTCLLIQNFLRVVDRLSTLAFIFKSIMIVLPLWLAVAALAVPVECVALFGAALWTPTLFVGSFSFCLRWPAPGGGDAWVCLFVWQQLSIVIRLVGSLSWCGTPTSD